jgi:predicted dienelactone hydrolase
MPLHHGLAGPGTGFLGGGTPGGAANSKNSASAFIGASLRPQLPARWGVVPLTMTALALLLTLAAYDPLVVPSAEVERVEVSLDDSARHREIPLRLYLPASKGPAPVILFSHGLGGSRGGDVFLGEHWAKRGYVAVFLQHPGSDTSVWADAEKGQRMAAMKKAANVENFMLRVEDVHAVLDGLTTWNATEKHALKGRLDLTKVGMSGHSFGAVTTQAVSGQQFRLGKSATDARIKAAMALSPSTPRMGSTAEAFGSVKLPWLLMTGTHDEAPIGGQTAASRLEVFPALPKGQKYELVLDGAEHSAFTDRALPGDSQPRNPNHHTLMLAISTAFFDSTLKGDAAARAWIDGPSVKALLQKGDRWQVK